MPPTQLNRSRLKNPDDTGNISSRRLIYLPIVHTQADMGALKNLVSRLTLETIGRAGLTRKTAIINKIWEDIENYIDKLTLSFDRVRLYQDGLPVCGQEIEIVTDLAAKGSRNHELLLRLIAQGAVLMGTESGDLLLQEYQLSKQSLTFPPPRAAGVMARLQSASNCLLVQRDKFIAERINDTLNSGETGILFIGILHSPTRYLDQDITMVYPFHRPR
jgi:hypothetical protein